MNSDSYVFARLDDVRYAVPTAYVLKILSDPSSIAVPDAPEGICGVVYDEGIIMPVRCFNLKRREPSELVVLCIGQSGYMAYAADSVETMGTISMGTDIEDLGKLPLKSQDELNTINEMYKTITEQNTQLLALYDSGEIDQGLALANGDIENNAVKMRTAINTIIDRAQTRAENKHSSTISLVKQQKTLALIMSILVLLLTMVLCLALTRSIKRPLDEMERAAKQLAEGDLSQDITYESKDELGVLASGLRNTIAAMRMYIKEIDAAMIAIGDGKLNYTSSVEFKGDFVSIKKSLTKISQKLTDALIQINASAEQVVNGAEQIAGSGQSLSQATLEQASSVEELSATINDVSDRVNANAENAVATSRLTETVGEEIIKTSNQVMCGKEIAENGK